MNTAILAFFSLISLAALLAFLFWAYRDYCVDSFRQEMFTLRDKFFDEAVEGNLSFDSNAYGMIRTTMNGFIRFGHRLTLPHFICISVALSKYSHETGSVPFSKRLRDKLAPLDSDQKKIILKYYQEINFILVRHLILSSPLLLITVLVPLMVTLEAGRLVARASKTLKRPLDQLDTFALAEGET